MSETTKSYLEQYDAAPDAEKFPMVQRWMDTEPLPFFKELREKRPVLVTPACTLLARFDDCTEVLNMPKNFTVALYKPKMADYLMAHDDDALHTREKSLMMGLLNRDDLPAVRAMVGKIANGILDAANGKIDVVTPYCRMVPAMLVQQYFGLTGEEPSELIEWSYWNQYDTFHNQPFNLLSQEKSQEITDKHNACSEKLGKYIAELIVKRYLPVKAESVVDGVKKLAHLVTGTEGEQGLQDDIVARMLNTSFPDAVDFDIKRVGINAGGLLIGSIETTSQAVAQVLQFILQSPELLAQAKAAAREPTPDAFDGIVWEALRFVPISPYLFRVTANDYTIGKTTGRETVLRAGTTILPLTQSAMFDPLIFEAPEKFIPNRNWYHYFHFGFGSHECLGRYVGMVMIPEMARQVFLRDCIAPNGGIDFADGPFPEHYNLTWNA